MSGVRPYLVVALRLTPVIVAVVLASCGAAAAPDLAGACDRYAADDGSDRNAGTQSAPYETVQRLAEALDPGQTGCLRKGTYDEEVKNGYVLRLARGGRPGAPVTIRSAPGERAKLEGVVFITENAPHVVLRDIEIDGRADWLDDDTVSVQIMAADVRFENNRVTNRRLKSCMILGSNDDWGRADRTVVRGNVFHECGDYDHGMLDHGIYVENARDGEITGNVFTGTSGYAVHLYPNAQRMRVTRNVMVGNGGGVIIAGNEEHTSSGNLVERNVITGSREDYGIALSWSARAGSGNVARDNCIDEGRRGPVERGSGLSVSGTLVSKPSFRDAGDGDYRLRPGSACADLVGAGVGTQAASAPAVRRATSAIRRCKSKRTRRARARCARAAKRSRRA